MKLADNVVKRCREIASNGSEHLKAILARYDESPENMAIAYVLLQNVIIEIGPCFERGFLEFLAEHWRVLMEGEYAVMPLKDRKVQPLQLGCVNGKLIHILTQLPARLPFKYHYIRILAYDHRTFES
jgi:hypothetical protein